MKLDVLLYIRFHSPCQNGTFKYAPCWHILHSVSPEAEIFDILLRCLACRALYMYGLWMLLGPSLRYVCTLTMLTLCRRTKVSRLSNSQLAASIGEGDYIW